MGFNSGFKGLTFHVRLSFQNTVFLLALALQAGTTAVSWMYRMYWQESAAIFRDSVP